MNELFKIFENFESSFSTSMTQYNVSRKDKDLKVELVLPGFKKEEISIETENDKLTIEAISKEEVDKNEVFLWKGFSRKNFKKTIVLPSTYSYEGIEASYEEGILTVMLKGSPKNYNKIIIK